jgi:hypothetical protein
MSLPSAYITRMWDRNAERSSAYIARTWDRNAERVVVSDRSGRLDRLHGLVVRSPQMTSVLLELVNCRRAMATKVEAASCISILLLFLGCGPIQHQLYVGSPLPPSQEVLLVHKGSGGNFLVTQIDGEPPRDRTQYSYGSHWNGSFEARMKPGLCTVTSRLTVQGKPLDAEFEAEPGHTYELFFDTNGMGALVMWSPVVRDVTMNRQVFPTDHGVDR